MEYGLAIVFRTMLSRDPNQVPFSCVFRWGAHHQWSQCSGIQGHCLRSPACPARPPDRVASAPSLAASARISRTLSAWPNHQTKWKVPNHWLSPPPLQVLGWWHDGPAWPKSALGRWARHFGSLRAYRIERRSPLTCAHLWISCTIP